MLKHEPSSERTSTIKKAEYRRVTYFLRRWGGLVATAISVLTAALIDLGLVSRTTMEQGVLWLSIGIVAQATFMGLSDRQSNQDLEGEPGSDLLDRRVAQLRNAIKKNRTTGQRAAIVSSLLALSQCVMGAFIATSAALRDIVPGDFVGAMGVMVAISAAIHQHFRFDIRSEVAKERTRVLEAIHRDYEDGRLAQSEYADKAPTNYALAKALSKGLSDSESIGPYSLRNAMQRSVGESRRIRKPLFRQKPDC